MILLYDPSGPLMQHIDGVLHIKDLNPEIYTKWRMSRSEMFKLGWRCIRAALSKSREPQAGMGSLSGGRSQGDGLRRARS